MSKKYICAALTLILVLSACMDKPILPRSMSKSGQEATLDKKIVHIGEGKSILTEMTTAMLKSDAWFHVISDATLDGTSEVVITPDIAKNMGKLFQNTDFIAISQEEWDTLSDNSSNEELLLFIEEGERRWDLFFSSDETREEIRLAVDFSDIQTGVTQTIWYRCDRDMYDGLYKLIGSAVREKQVILSRNDYITLDTPVHPKEMEYGAYPNEKLEIGDILLMRRQMDGNVCAVDAFDPKSGSLLYTYELPQEQIIRMEKYSDEQGFDYRILTQNRILYKNSIDKSAEKSVPLPEFTALKYRSGEEIQYGSYDLRGEKLAYEGEQGIYIGNIDQNKVALVLENNLSGTTDEMYEVRYTQPKLLNDSNKLSAVFTYKTDEHSENVAYGLVLLDLFSGDKKIYRDTSPMSRIECEYPDDNSIAVSSDDIILLIDAKTGEERKLNLNMLPDQGWYSADYNMFLVYEQDMLTGAMNSYLCTADDLSNRQRVFLKAKGEYFVFAGVTKNYVVAGIHDRDGDSVIVLPFS